MGIGTNLGKGEVECSIHSGGTILIPRKPPFSTSAQFHGMRLVACHCASIALRCGAKSGQFVLGRFAMKPFDRYGYMTVAGFVFIAGMCLGNLWDGGDGLAAN